MVNRNNSRGTLRFLTRTFYPFFHHPRNPVPLPPATSCYHFTTVTGSDENHRQLLRSIVRGEHKALSLFNPLRNSMKTKQLGVGTPSGIQHRCYGSMAGLVQRNPGFSRLNDDDVRYFEGILGTKNAIQDEEKLIAANTDWMHKYKGSSKLLLQPSSTDQVLLLIYLFIYLFIYVSFSFTTIE